LLLFAFGKFSLGDNDLNFSFDPDGTFAEGGTKKLDLKGMKIEEND
jgi:hypothetical protein